MYSLFKFFPICKTINQPARFNSEVINKSGTLDKKLHTGKKILIRLICYLCRAI
jgi:hypothetical protein